MTCDWDGGGGNGGGNIETVNQGGDSMVEPKPSYRDRCVCRRWFPGS